MFSLPASAVAGFSGLGPSPGSPMVVEAVCISMNCHKDEVRD